MESDVKISIRQTARMITTDEITLKSSVVLLSPDAYNIRIHSLGSYIERQSKILLIATRLEQQLVY